MTPYPLTGTSFTVTRTGGGTVSATGASLASTELCIQVTVQTFWPGPNNLPMNRSLSTILTKGGALSVERKLLKDVLQQQGISAAELVVTMGIMAMVMGIVMTALVSTPEKRGRHEPLPFGDE